MKQTNYIGTFKNSNGNTFTLEVNCNGFIQAFILLTADAIREGRHYQLLSIIDDKANVRHVKDILNIAELFF